MTVRPAGRPAALGCVALSLSVCLSLSSCVGENSLGGCVRELFPLEVSRVEVLRNEEALQVSYFRNDGPDVDLLVQLTVSLKNVQLVPGVPLVLSGEYEVGHQRTTIVHVPAHQPARILPPVRDGVLELSSGGEPGQLTQGTFSVSFEQNGEYGSGRTLTGTFKAEAVDAGFGP